MTRSGVWGLQDVRDKYLQSEWVQYQNLYIWGGGPNGVPGLNQTDVRHSSPIQLPGQWNMALADGSSMYAQDQGGWLGRVFNSDGTVNENLTENEANEIYNQVQVDLPFIIGDTEKPDSVVDKYFANPQNLGISSDYMTTYNKAKADLAKTMNMTPNIDQYGYSGTMTASNIYYNYLKEQGLL